MFGIDLLQERDQGAGGVTAEPVGDVANWVMLAEDLFRRGVAGQSVKDGEQVIAVSLCGVSAEVQLVLVPCPLEPLTGTGKLGGRNKLVIFEKADEDATQNPGGCGLGDRVGTPVFKVLRRPFGGLRRGEFFSKGSTDVGHLGRFGSLEKIGLDIREQLLLVFEEGLAVDHGSFQRVLPTESSFAPRKNMYSLLC